MSRQHSIPRPLQYVALAALTALALVLVVLAATRTHGEGSTGAGAGRPSTPAATDDAVPSLWIGDSFTAGTGADSASQAESCLTAAALGWICNVDAQGATGFVADGKGNQPYFTPLAGRLEATADRYLADVIVVDAGRNDGALPWEQVEAAATSYFADLRAAYPDAKIVVVVPYFMDGGTLPRFAAMAEEQAEVHDMQVIDPVAEGWIGPDTADLTIDDGVHPNQAGHQLIADNLERRLRELGVA